MRKIKILNLAVIAASLVLTWSCKKSAPAQESGTYKTLTVSKGKSVLNKEYTSTLEGIENVELRPQVSGTITKICVEEGSKVRKGQVMFVIDQVPYKAALQNAIASVRSAKAALENAELTLKSKKQLREQKVVGDYDVSEAQNKYNEALATLQNAQASEVNARNNLSYTLVKSPADGVIGMIPYRVGALVSSSIEEPLTTVANNSKVYAYFSITESEMQRLISEYGSLSNALAHTPHVKLRLSDGSDYTHEGTVDAISGNVNPETGSVEMRATFPNPEGKLRNGGTATVVMPYEYSNVYVIPQEATFEMQDKVFVYKVVNGKTQSKEIKVLSMNDGTNYVVLSGLNTGDVIIAEGAGLLHDGISVSTKNEKN